MEYLSFKINEEIKDKIINFYRDQQKENSNQYIIFFAEGEDFTDFINPQSLVTKEHALLESSLRDAAVGVPYQFMRQGYFVKDPDSSPDKPVFNRIVSLKDGWAKKQKA